MKIAIALLFVFSGFKMIKGPAIHNPVVPGKEIPQGYFRNPLNIPIQLAANFGELRPNHFHMGLDIRTNQRENLPVFAAANGYVSRIKIERFGFGRAIYIAHPNGYTTLYAHLNGFYNDLEDFVTRQQYADEQWEQEIEFSPNQFPVKKGQMIAYSGNTGGSQGPHLHFEIRDTETGNNLNPWLFNLGLPDNIKPFIYRLFYFDRRYSTYSTSPAQLAIKGGNGVYTTQQAIASVGSPTISLGIAAEDKTTATSFRFGIYKASVFVDGKLRSAFTLNDINYNDTRYLNASIDFKTKLSGGSYIQHLSQLPGNRSTIFSDAGHGLIDLSDGEVHDIRIEVKDVAGNTSVLTTRLKWNPAAASKVVKASDVTMQPNQTNSIRSEDVEAEFSPLAFYDTVPFSVSSASSTNPRAISRHFEVGQFTIPVHDSFTLRIRPIAATENNMKEKAVIVMKSGRKQEAFKGDWSNGFMQIRSRDLGEYTMIVDNTPPTIRLLGWINGGRLTGKSLALIAKDDVSELEQYNFYIDGKWSLFSRKSDTFIHVFSDVAKGQHELKAVITDLAGNTTEKSFVFYR